MHDRDDTMKSDGTSTLAAALRSLPQASPQPDLWPGLSAALARRRRPTVWRYALPVAAAASLGLFAVLPRGLWREGDRPVATSQAPHPATLLAAPAASAPATGPTDELDTLHQRSQSLERWIAAFAANAPQDSRDLMAAVEIEDLIGLVDVQLDASRGDADALPLWRQRVALLQDLATIRGNAYAVASNEGGAVRSAAPMLN